MRPMDLSSSAYVSINMEESSFPKESCFIFLNRQDGNVDTSCLYSTQNRNHNEGKSVSSPSSLCFFFFFLYDLEQQRTHLVEFPRPQQIHGWCGCSLNDKIYIFGSNRPSYGQNRLIPYTSSSPSPNTTTICYRNISEQKTKKTITSSSLSSSWRVLESPFFIVQCFPLENNQILVVTKENENDKDKDYHVYNPKTNKFSHLHIGESAGLTAAVVINNVIFFMGDYYVVCKHDEEIAFKYGLYNIDSKSWQTPISYIGIGSRRSQQRINLFWWNFDAIVYRKRWIVMRFPYGGWKLSIFDMDTKEMKTSNYFIPHVNGSRFVGVAKNYLVIETKSTPKYVDLAYLLPKWCIVGHLITLRALLEENRAHIIDSYDKIQLHGHQTSKLDFVSQRLMIDLDLYLFRSVLSFLVPN